ncbi:MAG: histidine kinase, partial [Chitinophagaceae bacterium]|nr:histidine kinase [Chitinophagaceae bacterium]
MSIEPIIAFFLLWDLRKILRTTSPLPEWDKNIKLAMYAVAALFIIETFLPVEAVTMWIWHLLLFAIIGIIYFNSAFFTARTIMLAVLPFVLLSLFADIFKLLLGNRYKVIDNYLDVATVFSIIWMVAMLIISRKQQKALQKERLKTHEEEEQKMMMAERKAELEKIVAERTAELTQQKEELEKALVELKTTQAQLIQQEKLA